MFNILLEEIVFDDLKKIQKSDHVFILKRIQEVLSQSPFPKGKNPKKLQGTQDFRLRIGNYRIIYSIEKNTVKVYAIGHRKKVYKKINRNK